MKKRSTVMAASLLVTSFTIAAFAADSPTSSSTANTSHVTTTVESGAGKKEFKADQQIIHGTISGIDQHKGSLTLKTTDGQNLTLNFPLDVVTNYKEGDQVVLSMALSKASGPMESMR